MTTTSDNSRRALAMLVAMLALSLAASLLVAEPAQAATFTVRSASDQPDVNPQDSLCDANPASSVTECTLRAAIEQANASAGPDTIHFDIPGSSASKLIFPEAELPEITNPVTIDGYSQPGAQENTLDAGGTNAVIKIWLNGDGVPRLPGGSRIAGLRIAEGGATSTIRGLAITEFEGSGIEITDPHGVKVEGNFIGVDPSGTTKRANGDVGVRVVPDASGQSGATIGGASPAARNILSGNATNGVFIAGGGDGDEVLGNLIGTDRNGTADLGNGEYGVWVFGPTHVGDGTREGTNTIAFNGYGGVLVSNGVGSRILSNSIFSNGGIGIDLQGNFGVTPNDVGDADSGPNGLQNFPVVASAKTLDGKTTVKGQLISNPNETFTVQFFRNPASTNGGKKLIGQTQITTTVDGLRPFTFKPRKAVPVGQTITATATDTIGNTSEFSAPRVVVAK